MNEMEIRSKQMAVLMLSMFIFTLGFGITVPIMPFFAKSLGGTVVDVGILMAAFSAAELLLAPVWGKASDRIGRKPVIVIGLLGFGIAFACTGLSGSLWMLYASQIFAGALAAGIYPAVMASIADQTEPGQRGRYMGLLGAASGMGVIIGPVSASLIALLGLNVPYFAAAALGLITMAISLAWLPETRVQATVSYRCACTRMAVDAEARAVHLLPDDVVRVHGDGLAGVDAGLLRHGPLRPFGNAVAHAAPVDHSRVDRH